MVTLFPRNNYLNWFSLSNLLSNPLVLIMTVSYTIIKQYALGEII